MRRSCELCKAVARMYCDSDQASLCWDCDAKVHSANFLVARHSRSLLCYVCQSPTAWNASGEKFGPTVSVCLSCVDGCVGIRETEREAEIQRRSVEVMDTDDGYDDDDSEEDDDGDEDEEYEGDEEDGENQVVPLSLTPPPQSESSSSSEDSSNRDFDTSLKRLHHNFADLPSDEDLGLSSVAPYHRMTPSAAAGHGGMDNETAFVDSSAMRQWKSRRVEASWSARAQNERSLSRSASIVESLRRFEEGGMIADGDASEVVAELYRLSRDPNATDLDDLSLAGRRM